jgi:DNA polymerase-3 subunit beta
MNKGTRTTFEAIEVIEEGKYIINAQRLSQIVKVMSDGEITIEVDDKLAVKISGESSSFTMFAFNGVEFPALPELRGERGFSIEGDKLREMIGKVMHSIAENESRPALCGAFFTVHGKNLKVVSCDSFTLSECSKECDISSLGEVEENLFKFILPGHALNEMNKILSDKRGTVKLYLARKHAILETEGLVFFTRRIDGDYFDYQRIIPRDQTIFVQVNRDRLLSGLERALLIADEKVQGSGKNYVRLEIRDQVLTLTSTSTNGRVYDEMACQHEGDDLVIGFNCRYLINNIRAANAEELLLALRSSNQAMLIRPAEEKDDETFFYMLLPVRIVE